jgi:hypothetical protein
VLIANIYSGATGTHNAYVSGNKFCFGDYMTHNEIVDVVQFLFPDNSILFRDEKVLQVEAKFTSPNTCVMPLPRFIEMFQAFLASQSYISGNDSIRISKGFVEFIERQQHNT